MDICNTANKELIKGIVYYTSNGDGITVIQHLRDVNINEEGRIELMVLFGIDFDSLSWYKNNEVIKEDDRKIIHTINRLSCLEVFHAKISDTATYFAVARTKRGIISSFADVYVRPRNETIHKDPNPIIEMPSEIDIMQRENLRLICKVDIDINTSIRWLKNGVPIVKGSNFVMEDYGKQYIGLRKTAVKTVDSGEYTLVLRDEVAKTEESCSCPIIVTPMSLKSCTQAVKVKRPLLSAVACIGSKVVFDCTFAVTNATYFHVVWYIGHYRIERTNSKFKVICKAGEYILFIKKLEADMAGKVVCELRQSNHQKGVHVVSSSAGYLTIVPSRIVDEESVANPPLQRRRNFFDKKCTFNNLTESSTESNVLDISYCRLDEDSSFFLNAFRGNVGVDVICTERKATFLLEIQWDNFAFPSSCWFEVSLVQSDGSYVKSGECSKPEITIRIPPVGNMLKIRVTPVLIPDVNWESSIYIEPPQEPLPKPSKSDDVRPVEEFLENYTETGDLLGSGTYGRVVLVRDKEEKHYAVKIIPTITQRSRERARREYDILKKVQHPKIIQLVEAFHGKKIFAIVMEFLWGGELFDRFVQEEHIMEEDVIYYVRQICEALAYLHSLNIAHLDIKPENVVCLNPNSRQVKIIDFGLAMVLEGRTMRTLYGTREYMAPEILNYNSLSLVSDMWSVGVVAYILLSGRMPFEDDTLSGTTAKIITASYDYNDEAFDDISQLAKDFVDKLLIVDTNKRMSAKQALQHAWLKTGTPKGAATNMKRTRENMKSYLASYRAKWQRAGHVMIAAHRLRLSTIGSNLQKAQLTNPSPMNTENVIQEQTAADTR